MKNAREQGAARLQMMILLGATVLVVIVASVISHVEVARERAALHRVFDQQIMLSATQGGAYLQDRFKGISLDLFMLTGIPPIPGYIRAMRNQGRDPEWRETTDVWLDRLATIFTALMRSHPDYAQIRFIGVADQGREIVRVDQHNGKIWRVPAHELQQKGENAYFRDTIKLGSNGLYLSAINLNREQGQVEIPPRPMVRAATPVIATDGEVIGILIINVNFNDLTQGITSHFPSTLRGYLVNHDGDFLWHPDPRRAFGFDLGTPFRLHEEFPEFDMKAVSDSTDSTMATPVQELPMIAAPTAASPVKELATPDTYRRVSAIRVPIHPTQPEQSVLLLAELPSSQIDPLLAAARSSLKTSVGLSAALILLFLWWAIRKTFKPFARLTEAAQAIAQGRYDTTLPTVRGAEMVALRSAFATMQAEVATREAELRAHRDNLEHLVSIATTEVTAIVQSAVNGIITISEQGIIHIFNPAAEKLFGWTATEVVGQNVSILMGEPHASAHDGYIASFLRTGETKVIGSGREITAYRKDGSAFPAYLAIGHAQLSATQHIFVAFLSDITLQKQREEELQRAKESAEAAARTKSDFLANMSHEIRTPMNAILGLCYLLEKQDMTPVSRGMVQKIHGAGRSLLGIINDILDFSKIEAQRLDIEQVPFRLSDILDNLASIMSAAVGDKTIEVLIDPAPEGMDFLKGDPLRLGQVLINLAGNAIKFTQVGEVAVQITCQQYDPAAETACLRFSVRDTGIGIPKDKQAAIFHAFSQADTSTTRSFGGTGLGLTISRRLVELMGGALEVNSEPGRGSEFAFEIPFGLSDPSRNTMPEMLHQHILIADDQDTARRILARTAASLGWRVDTVESGEQAVAVAGQATDKPYDILLLDWRMPEMDGLSAALTIREQCRLTETPIIIMVTAFDRDRLIQQPGSEIVDVVLTKPVTSSCLYNAALEAKNRRGLLESRMTAPQETQRLIGLQVLVVDDSEINREVAKRILEGEGATVELAEDGSLALTALNGHPNAFDVVLMDVQMPVMDGYTATRQMRATPRLAHIPVVALTAGAFKIHRDAAFDAGVDDFVAKPFNVDELIGVVLRLTHRERSDDEPMALDSSIAAPPDPAAAEPASAVVIDIERGLAIWRDEAVYQQYLRKFAHDYGHSLDDLSGIDADTASRFAHKLKGAAGNLALLEVAALAADMERALQAGDDPTDSGAKLRAALSAALASIGRYAPADPPPETPAPDCADPAQMAALLAQTLAACNTDNPDAVEPLLNQLNLLLPTDQLAPLRDAVQSFDFRGAEAATRALAAALNISLET